MGRKKKEPDGGYVTIPEPRFFEPETIDITSLDDTTRRYMTTRPSYTTLTTTSMGSGDSYIIPPPPSISTTGFTGSWTTTLSGETFGHVAKRDIDELLCMTEKIKKEDLPKVRMDKRREPQYMGERYRVVCENSADLLPDRVLKNLSIVKSKLMMECAPYRIWKIECKMTPAVKQNIIKAYRRNNMFGKKTPFIARFDEYGRRLEDDVHLDTLEGMTINIVNPDDYGPLYLEFTGLTEEPYSHSYEEDLPF